MRLTMKERKKATAIIAPRGHSIYLPEIDEKEFDVGRYAAPAAKPAAASTAAPTQAPAAESMKTPAEKATAPAGGSK